MDQLKDVVEWLGNNGGVLYAGAVSLIAIWGAKKALHLKVFETAVELNQKRHEITWGQAIRKLREEADDVEDFVKERSNDLDWGQAKLQSLSGDKEVRTEAKRQLLRLQKPKFLREG